MRAATRQGRYGLGLVAAVGVMGAAVLALAAVPRISMGFAQPLVSPVERLSLPMAPAGVLQILNAGGQIAVSAWDGDRALLTITREAVRGENWFARWCGRQPNVTTGRSSRVRQSDEGVEVSTLNDSGDAANYRIDVKLPRGRGLAASNGNGPITVAGIDGNVRAVSENGDVHCEAVSGRVDAKTQNGNVFCRYVSGAIDVNATNGSVVIEHGSGAAHPVRVWTTNGPIRFSATVPSVNLLAETQNGRVVSGVTPGDGVHRTMRTLDARGEAAGVEVELHAINGNIYVDAF